jgi:hypothetical protein
MHHTFNPDHLAQRGFRGFLRIGELRPPFAQVPGVPGLYVVTLEPPTSALMERSVGGHFKRRDPTVRLALLEEKWVPGVSTFYLGRANDLSKRIALLARFGRGEPVAHWGGRYLWQLAEHEQLRIAWLPHDDPVRAESELLDEFEIVFGQLPFANLVRGARVAAL